MLKTKWTYRIAVLAGMALLVLPWLFPVCSLAGHSTPMRCFFAFQTEFLLALLAVIIAISLFFTRERETKQLTGFFLLVIAVLIFVVPSPGVIGICGHGDSPCQATTGWTRAVSAVLGLAGLAVIWQLREKADEA